MSDKPSIYKRTFQFGCRVVQMERTLARDKRVNRNALGQLVRAALSVGANLEEARAAQNKADRHAKLRISLKEARESHDLLRMIQQTGVSSRRMEPLVQEAHEIVEILTTIEKQVPPG